MKKTTLLYLFLLSLLLGAVACKILLPGEPNDDSLIYGPIADLTPSQNALVLAGDGSFNDDLLRSKHIST